MSQVSELSALKYENNLLRQQALHMRVACIQTDFTKLQQEAAELLAMLRKEAGVDNTVTYNPTTRSF